MYYTAPHQQYRTKFGIKTESGTKLPSILTTEHLKKIVRDYLPPQPPQITSIRSIQQAHLNASCLSLNKSLTLPLLSNMPPSPSRFLDYHPLHKPHLAYLICQMFVGIYKRLVGRRPKADTWQWLHQ